MYYQNTYVFGGGKNKGEVDILIDSAAKTKSFNVACLQTEKEKIY